MSDNESKWMNLEPTIGKMDSFFGDRSIVVSSKTLEGIKKNPLTKDLYMTDIGFYPAARRHFRKRTNGIDEHILIYCIDGNGIIQINEQSYLIEPNCYFVIPAHTPHKYWASEVDPWSIYWIHFGGSKSQYFEQFFNHIIKIKLMTSARIDDRINLFNEILTTLELGLTQENIEFANLSFSFLLATFFYNETYIGTKGYINKSPVDKAIFLMQNSLKGNLTVHDIASHVNLSESHLSKVFKNKTGSSPFDFYIGLKMQEAIRLLTNQSMKIKEVAYTLGYEDPFYFSRLFKKHIGTSPMNFLSTSKDKPTKEFKRGLRNL